MVENEILKQQAYIWRDFELVIPSNTIIDADNDPLNYTAISSNGENLPLWLNFSSATRRFSGSPKLLNFDGGTYHITVIANDGYSSALADFSIDVSYDKVIEDILVYYSSTGLIFVLLAIFVRYKRYYSSLSFYNELESIVYKSLNKKHNKSINNKEIENQLKNIVQDMHNAITSLKSDIFTIKLNELINLSHIYFIDEMSISLFDIIHVWPLLEELLYLILDAQTRCSRHISIKDWCQGLYRLIDLIIIIESANERPIRYDRKYDIISQLLQIQNNLHDNTNYDFHIKYCIKRSFIAIICILDDDDSILSWDSCKTLLGGILAPPIGFVHIANVIRSIPKKWYLNILHMDIIANQIKNINQLHEFYDLANDYNNYIIIIVNYYHLFKLRS